MESIIDRIYSSIEACNRNGGLFKPKVIYIGYNDRSDLLTMSRERYNYHYNLENKRLEFDGYPVYMVDEDHYISVVIKD
jgi:hypothetical protein